MSAYVRPASLDAALALLAEPGAQPLGGGTDLVPLQSRGKAAGTLVDVRALLGDSIDAHDDGLVIGAATRISDVADDARVAERYAALSQAACSAASPQLRNQGTVAGNLAQHVRCWYFRHPDLTCWLAGGETCYAQIGDHRKHGLEAGDCISVAPSDLAGALLALDARVRITGANGERRVPVAELYARPSEQHRSSVQLARNELITAVDLPAPPDRSAYERAGERAAWTFALAGIAAARFGGTLRLAAIGLTNEPRLLDPSDPLGGLPGLEQTGWKRELAGVLCERALARVSP
jgi:xanthine dehydrogenase YagS FAD-binding subunit